MTQYINFFKKYTLPISLVVLLVITGCASSNDSVIDNEPSVSKEIILDQSLNDAIDSSLENYQAVLIVFYRGYFWGICRAQLGELAQNHSLFKRFGIDIITVSTDDYENTNAMRSDVGATFSMISDTTYTISQEWEVYNLLGDGVAAPSAFIIGKNDEILWSHRGTSPSDRPPTDYLLAKALDVLKKISN